MKTYIVEVAQRTTKTTKVTIIADNEKDASNEAIYLALEEELEFTSETSDVPYVLNIEEL